MKWKHVKAILDTMTPAQLNQDVVLVSKEFNMCNVGEAVIATEAIYSDGQDFFTKTEIKENDENVSDYDCTVKKNGLYISF